MTDQTADPPEPTPREEAPPAPGAPRTQQQGQQQRQRHGGGRPQQQGNSQPQWPELSVVIPLYNEEESLRELHGQLRAALNRMNVRYELLFVDDGSTDRSFQVLRDLKRNDRHVKIIRFRRNYGKSAALAVGFDKAQGNIVVTMDADLQDDPAEIPSLKKRIDDGLDLVSGWKKRRKDPITKTIPSRFFNFVTARMTGIRIHDFNCGLKAYRREVVKSVKLYGELHRYVPVLAHWEGFRVGEVVVQHRARKYGHTKFGLGRFWRGFLDLCTALFTTRYLTRPLHLFGVWGIVATLAGVAIDGWLAVEWYLGRTSLGNRPLFLVGILLIIVGLQFFSLGLLGEMISKTRAAEPEYQIREFIK
ncbi:MAG TPA: glycosyltransferase family 2 protein [Bacteroidota bacterium]|nr:glycosyltransferase family 2 protein [Bacteroidota bacterium]